MAIIKDLGRVKGEDGDVFLPTIREDNGEFIISWERISSEEAEQLILDDYPLRLPIYVPEMNGTNLSFRLSKPTKDVDGTFLKNIIECGNIKGDRGPEGIVRYNIQQVDPSIDITDPSIERRIDTLYVQGEKAWIYDPNAADPQNPFVRIEGMDLSPYALIENVYSKNDIDEMLNGVTGQVEKIMQLYDVNSD